MALLLQNRNKLAKIKFMKDKTLNYTVIFQKEPEGGYTVFAPLLPGCVTYGKDLDEAKKMIEEAIRLYLQSLKFHKEPVPEENEVFYAKVNIDPVTFKLSYA